MLMTIIGISIVSVAVCLLLKKSNPEFAMLAALLSGILILGLIVLHIVPIFDTIEQYASQINLNNSYFMAVIKALGVCYLTQLAADTCHDSGYTAIASKVELAGKIAILIIALPLFEHLIELASNLVTLGS